MNDSTPNRMEPSEKTLHFIRLFARMYPSGNNLSNQSEEEKIQTGNPTAFC